MSLVISQTVISLSGKAITVSAEFSERHSDAKMHRSQEHGAIQRQGLRNQRKSITFLFLFTACLQQNPALLQKQLEKRSST